MTGIEAHSRINEIETEMRVLREIIEEVKSKNGGKNLKQVILENCIERIEAERDELFKKLESVNVE